MPPNPLPPHEVWWRLLLGRLAQVERGLPPALRGSVQLAVSRPEAPSAYFYLTFEGKQVHAGSGICAEPEAWIETSEAELEALLSGKAEPALHVSGDAGLVKTVLAAMDKTGPKSMIGLRASQG